MKLAYCDFIAYVLRTSLKEVLNDPSSAVKLLSVSNVEGDWNSDGSFKSPAKTIFVKDANNSVYKITVEQAG